MQKKDHTHHFFKTKQIKKKYCNIMVVYVKISKKYIEVNENNITVSCFVTYLSFKSFLSFVILLNNFVLKTK